MILIAEMVYVLMRSLALEYIRNRKTVQMIKKKTKKTQNQNKFRSKSKTGSKIREDVHVVESVKAYIFRREFGKTLSRID